MEDDGRSDNPDEVSGMMPDVKVEVKDEPQDDVEVLHEVLDIV